MDIVRAENAKLLRHYQRDGNVTPFAWHPSDSYEDYYERGCHPEIVERLWRQIGPALPKDCRSLVCGVPALTHRVSGVVLAIGMGTQYCVRLVQPFIGAAVTAGAKTANKWTDGRATDLREELGADWVFGAWLSEEPIWCRETYKAFS